MPELLERRKRDLEEQFATLPREFEHWKQLSTQRSYEKHFSQIAALSRQMLALNETVRHDWNGASDFVAIQKAQRNCGAVHVMWNYFREKLLMRADPELGSYLRAADAYVWACYEPVLEARRAADPERPFREPPLVAFSGELSPWALSRHGSYVPQGDSTGATSGALFEETLTGMPIAIVGVPWQSAELLPSLALLAHETGHVVESDFELGGVLHTALSTATATSELREGWSEHWRKEVFADLFACYVAGPSYVWTLVDAIPDSPDTVKVRRRPSGDGTAERRWGRYPPATLRILLNLEALRFLGHAQEAARISAYWLADYPEHAMGEFGGDLAAVVKAVYQAAALPNNHLNFSHLAEGARVYLTAVEQKAALDLKEKIDPRVLVAVAVRVHRDPVVAGDKAAVWARLQEHIVSARPPGLLDDRQKKVPQEAAAWLRTEQLAEALFRDHQDDGQ